MKEYIKNPDALHKELERFFGCNVNKNKMVKLANEKKSKFRRALIEISKLNKERRKEKFIKTIGDIF